MSNQPVTSFFKWKLAESEGLADLPDVYVQTLSFPNSVLWVWIGDQKADLANLSLAMKSHRIDKPKLADIHSTTVINPNESNETTVKSKTLAKKLSVALNGRPVYLSYSLSQSNDLIDDMLNLSEMETKLFQLIKENLQSQ